ncbi:replicative DNA helicase [Bacteroidetes bacterium endosymbiont of Geopemphigus sp.]|uniref:replicative DNA helicase n=1 Tax=Bacteroidetes bacterium endosymbiont of Geopemphigus sp. TaxID=2047937 RepID=UPI000CD15993|nr:replicative DNA helicase [Bacteroidetes bacterium endosymbiont of Geopemphigus sp.]
MDQSQLLSYNKKETREIPFERGKFPPQALSMEEAVLGAMMIDKKGLDEVIDILTQEVFYKPEHQEIFRVIQKLFHDAQPIDLYTVSSQLRKDGKIEAAGGDYYLVRLTQKVVSSAHIEYHSRIVQQKFILRRLIEISSSIIEKSYEETTDVFDLLDSAESSLFDIAHHHLKKGSETAQSLISQAIERIKSVELAKGLSGVSAGFRQIDSVTSGWQKSDLIILAARPGMGKTAFMLSMARNIVVDSNIPVALFSLEMSSVQLITRLIAAETGISSQKLRKGQLSSAEWEQLYTKVKTLEEAPLFIDDTPALSVFDLRAKCRRMVSQQGVGLILIDYLQLMTIGAGNKTGNREQEISIISRSLKSVAKELDVPVIALSQLSRAVETRGGSKRPLLSDLRESGAIEQDADIVSFIYRPEYYGFSTWDADDAAPCHGQAEIIIAKHRNGGLDNVRLRFISEQAKFIDMEEYSISDTLQEYPFLQADSKLNDNDLLSSKDPSQTFNSEEDRDGPLF